MEKEIGRNRGNEWNEKKERGDGSHAVRPRLLASGGPVLDFYVLTSFHSVYESPLRFTSDHRRPFLSGEILPRPCAARPRRKEKGRVARETTRRWSGDREEQGRTKARRETRCIRRRSRDARYANIADIFPAKRKVQVHRRSLSCTMWIDKGRCAEDARDIPSQLLVSSIETVRVTSTRWSFILLYNWSRYESI